MRRRLLAAILMSSAACCPGVAMASAWRGSGGHFEIALTTSHGLARGELATDGCQVPPFMDEEIPATRFVDGRLSIDALRPTSRGHEGYRVKLRRSADRIRGTVTIAGGGCEDSHRVVLRRRDTPVAGGTWTGSTDQQAAVRFWASPFGIYLRWAGGPESPVAPTVIASCEAGADRRAVRPGWSHIMLRPNGQFSIPGEPSTGTFDGRLRGHRAAGTLRYAPDGCDSGVVAWRASAT